MQCFRAVRKVIKIVNTLDRCPKSTVLFTYCFNRRTKFCEIIHLSGGIELDIFRVSFIGHRVVDEYRQVEEELDEVIELLHRKYGFIDFNVGRNGEFDDLATQAVRRFRKEWAEWCELTLVEPYPVANLDILEKSYDNVIIPTDRKCHFKAAIGERNKWLAENCDMMIVYIKRDYGGAYKCYKHAQELGVPIMNIADNIKNQEW